MTFNDEFSSTVVDWTRWSPVDGWGNQAYSGKTTLQCWVPEALSTAAGLLSITVKPQKFTACRPLTDTRGLQYSSGMMSTAKSFSQMYGYFEARLRQPKGQGFWTDFWLLSSALDWPPEINVVEWIGTTPDTAYHSFHWADPATGTPLTSTTTYKGPDLSAALHTYGVDWAPGMLTYYVDGVMRAQYKSPNIPKEPLYLLLDVAVGGDWGGPPNASTVFPAKMQVDYVRAYARVNDGKPDAIPPFGGDIIAMPTAPAVIDAIDMSKVTRTAGNLYDGTQWGYGTGYGFWNNGYIQETIAFPATGYYDFTVKAFGDWKLGISPIMEIRIDGKAVATVSNIAPRPWGTYKLPIQVTGGQHLVAMALVNGNDWKTGIGEKRSLIIDTLTIANGTPPAAITAPPAKVLVSSTPSRANAAPLLDAAVTGNIYAFATADLAASKVQFWLDNATPAAPTGAPMTSDDTAPFDFAGADPTTGQALPFNVGALTNGLHTITAVTTMLDGSVQTPVTTSFMVNKVDIFVTDVPDRSNAKVLRGATVTGNIYVFTGPDTGVQMVEFWLDDATPSNPTGVPSKIEKLQPFDFGGTSNTLTALPFNATSLAVGPHTLTARVTMSDGTVNPPVVARFTRN